MSGWSLSTSVTAVRTLINEDTAGFWTDTELENWIKEGTLDWCAKSLLMVYHDTITLVSGQQTYTTSTSNLINSSIRTLHASYDNVALQRVSYEQIMKHNARSLSSDATPAYYFDIYNGTSMTFYVGPTPTDTEAGNTIAVIFAYATDEFTLVPWEYQPTIFLYAAHKAKLKERQYQEAYLYYQQYINNIVFSRADNINRGVQTVDAFRIR